MHLCLETTPKNPPICCKDVFYILAAKLQQLSEFILYQNKSFINNFVKNSYNLIIQFPLPHLKVCDSGNNSDTVDIKLLICATGSA